MFGHDHIGSLLFFVNIDFLDLRRAQSLGDELAEVIAPLDDVDLLTSQFVDHLPNPRASCPDASTFGINVGIIGDNGNLAAMARLPSDVDDLHGSVRQFGHFQLQEPANQIGV